MSILRCLLIVLALAAVMAGCQHDPVSEPAVPGPNSDAVDVAMAAAEVMTVSGWRYHPEAQVPERVAGRDIKSLEWITDWSREELPGGVAHYAYDIQVGPGDHDRVMIHRVVKETSPGRPIHTDVSIFLQHGDAVGFVKFLYGPAAPSIPDDHAAAIYLAQNDVDVWGIDQNWVLVPEETVDFSFMQDWGLDNQIANVRAGMAVARYTRYFVGDGFRKMPLLGYSSGGATGYAYINHEAVKPRYQRHASGFVCADMIYKFAPEDEEYRQFICDDVALIRDRLDSGDYAEPIPFVLIGDLATNQPDEDSPIMPGMTNMQVALLFGAGTFQVWPYNAWWHYFGGSFDEETGLPVDLHFTSVAGMCEFMLTGCPWEALRFMGDYESILCDDDDVPWDDNLSLVEIPILYLEPAGGLGATGRYTLDLFTSATVQIATASLMPEDLITEDFGHIDMWTAPEAVDLVWQPLLDWLVAHNGPEDDDLHPIGNGMQ
jgi:hypothetical protein